MKRTLAVIFSALLILSLGGCKGADDTTDSATTTVAGIPNSEDVTIYTMAFEPKNLEEWISHNKELMKAYCQSETITDGIINLTLQVAAKENELTMIWTALGNVDQDYIDSKRNETSQFQTMWDAMTSEQKADTMEKNFKLTREMPIPESVNYLIIDENGTTLASAYFTK